ncbi:unnamed protein product [Lampetra planeri]
MRVSVLWARVASGASLLLLLLLLLLRARLRPELRVERGPEGPEAPAFPPGPVAPVAPEESPRSPDPAAAIRRLVLRMNAEQRPRNAGRALTWRPGGPVVVVQVHSRAAHLRLLVESLGAVRGIETALLVFSHDEVSEEVDAVVRGVRFCQVLQIFYPFSAQLHAASFPGPDPRDCPRNASPLEAQRLGCTNAATPDRFGHYREAAFTQAKHHWWWKLHFVWRGLRMLRGHPGPVLLLEEDHFVLPDALALLASMGEVRRLNCADCDLLSLGVLGPAVGGAAAAAAGTEAVDVAPWHSSRHNTGMAVMRTGYEKLSRCGRAFCTCDDYNWDWSVQLASVDCVPRGAMLVLATRLPRVLHTGGGCGMHHHRDSCGVQQERAHAMRVLRQMEGALFPAALSIRSRNEAAAVRPRLNGGWADPRDWALCLSQENRTTSPRLDYSLLAGEISGPSS